MATVVGVFAAPLRDLVGVLQARIDQLGGEDETVEAEPAAPEPQAAEESEPAAEEKSAEADSDDETPVEGEES
jgi:hypothetical protein